MTMYIATIIPQLSLLHNMPLLQFYVPEIFHPCVIQMNATSSLSFLNPGNQAVKSTFASTDLYIKVHNILV